MIPPGEKIIETKKCRLSGQDFFVTDRDLEFYDKVSPVFAGKKYTIPTPTLCPEERMRRRLCFRNESKLYQRKCDKTGREIVSIYSPDKPHIVYDQKVWWSDDWSAFEYGMDYDLERNFFEQFSKLLQIVPRYSLYNFDSENCDFTQYLPHSKNCYLTFGGWYSENCLYSNTVLDCKNCIDSMFIEKSERVYESIDCINLYNSWFCINTHNSHDCFFTFDCIDCSDCIGCWNLRNKQYCVFNKQVSKEEFEAQFVKMQSYGWHDVFQKFISAVSTQAIHKFFTGYNSRDFIGDYIYSSEKVFDSFLSWKNIDCKYSMRFADSNNCQDINGTGYSNFSYEISTCDYGSNNLFSVDAEKVSSTYYSNLCNNGNNLFGCVGLHSHEHHCILNKPYSTQEYEQLCSRIIDHMISTGEWGEFFPHELSPFGYNETVAQEYFPMAEAEVRQKGWNWHVEEKKPAPIHIYKPLPIIEYDEQKVGNIVAQKNIDSVLNGIIRCDITGKPFRIIKQELAFYIEHHLPIPTKHPDQRHKERMDLRNPRTLYERMCGECGKDIITTYARERPEKVVCEECYRRLVY